MKKKNMIDLDSLSREIGIDSSSVLELLRIYTDEMKGEMLEVQKLLRDQNWLQLKKTIHNIKGVSANLYLEDMVRSAQAIDTKLQNNTYQDIESSIREMLDVFQNTLEGIQQAFTEKF